MTKEKTLEKLLMEYPNGKKFEKFFRDTIDYFVGDGNIVTDYCFDQIRTYLSTLS